jgi:RNA polymerase sigma-70 factor (ECF subfamily)
MDAQLVVRAQEGDEVAFAIITQRSAAPFKQVAFRILRDRHLAEDATQQALVDIWRKLPMLRDPERFDGWSYRFLVHACYAEGKRYRRAYRELPGEQVVVTPDATKAINDRDELERGFRRLSLDHRAVVVLHYFLDLTLEDTAAALGISVGTAKSRLSRAMARLRAALVADAAAERPDREPVA